MANEISSIANQNSRIYKIVRFALRNASQEFANLAEDRGRDADAVPLYLSGSIGSLLRVSAWPACSMRTKCMIDSTRSKENMFRWAGRPLFDSANQAISTDVVGMAAKAHKDLHKLGILHGDAEPRNVLRDTVSGNIMVVDFERVDFRCRPPLGSLSSNVYKTARSEAAIYAAKMMQRI
ncbi:hypothetical protein CTAM01_16893 [Colletotrichum tamarilloi]|uniref:Protein kinase domain-containing protein n=1 Tax=Colletotrichum tamarilloi TaxID=1209934 RepID=A0ABQ9QH86_9PEZI|nr:uncharacterized protein CTAM01_16893 [Colletotrichum tamarilloi]KAK1470229.1 hypothetical protein CTAM01_16893 [Colletotrichum tamarilloi]